MMFRLSQTRLKIVSMVTLVFFFGATTGSFAQTETISYTIPHEVQAQAIDLSGVLGSNPEIMLLQSNAKTIENALKQIDTTAAPLYNRLVPSNMEAMSIAERVKAIVGNTKEMLTGGLNSYKSQVNDWNAAHGLGPNATFEQELSVGLNQLGIESAQMPLKGSGNQIVEKLKTVINALKDRLMSIVRIIRAKIAAVAQRVGLMKKKEDDGYGKSEQKRELEGYADVPQESVQYADNFSGKLAKGVSEGSQAAKQSLKSSFSFSNLAVTTAVAVGTNMALDMVNGKKPSLKAAAKSVATLEFAGSVVGSALGAAGGQFTASIVKSFIPGPVGALVGSVIPVMFASASGQMASSMVTDAKTGKFSLTKAWKQVDKVDLVGSSIGSTIGMALGAPIPILGPIIGGIVGGFLGSKIAKLVTSFAKGGKISIFKSGSNLTYDNPLTPTGQGITVGTVATGGNDSGSQGLGIYTGGGQLTTGLHPTSSVEATPEMEAVQKQYYDAYLQYNRLVESGQHEEAKKVFNDLKVYSDQYNALKAGKTK